jgi:RND superfamily putative drug exporter
VGSVGSLVAPGGDGLAPDGFRPSVQLQRIAGELAARDADPAAALEGLLEPGATEGLEEAAAYVEALGAAYPDLAALPSFTGSLSGLERLTAEIEEARAALRVSGQLEAIAAGIRSSTGDEDAAMGTVLLGFLGDLQAEYPEVAGFPEFQEIWSLMTGMAEGADPALLAPLAEAFEGLAARFEDRPDASLVSPALLEAAGGEAAAGIGSITVSLQADLESLAGEFADRPDFFIPGSLGGDAEDQIALIEEVYLSPDREVTRLTVILDEDPYSAEALDVVIGMRAAAGSAGAAFGPDAEVLVGGTTAAFVDIRQTINEDFYRVAAITIVGVLLVLMALLRAVVAPLYLVATVLLSWAGTMGISTLVFQEGLGHPAVNYFLPLVVFVLLVAIGSDYNIFLMSRVREESERHGVLDGIRIASARTGTVITSAGIILAGTFAALIAAPLRFLFQIGFAVALGVLIDTFVVRSLLVPAITALLGERAWWPSRLRRAGRDASS